MKKSTHKKRNGKGIRYTNEPIELEPVEDFLPPPEDLVLKDETVKVTLNLSKSSVNFFKNSAKKEGTAYQVMIRKVLDLYAAKYR
jgi:predicted DNA binding CopG/RHH family protein